ncbi:MAG: hypothetical protein QF411_07115, partial [Planctomycetota bacterium]|nr:hypothetical protein [Planctomycetota bacterium]
HGADRLISDLEEALELRGMAPDAWCPLVVSCSAGKAQGVEAVNAAIAQHRAYLAGERLERARAAMRAEQVQRVVGERLLAALWNERGYDRETERLLASAPSPHAAAEQALARILAQVDNIADNLEPSTGSQP